jgi:hypothetical protein
VLCLLALGGCASVSAPVPSELARGTWGGENASVMVTDSVAHVHIGCTFGNMPALVALDADGRFNVDGNYVLRAYPVFIGPELPAQFSGQVVGRTLTLAVAVNDTVEKKVVALGPVSVVYGREPNMGPCPICTVVPGRAPSPD